MFFLQRWLSNTVSFYSGIAFNKIFDVIYENRGKIDFWDEEFLINEYKFSVSGAGDILFITITK
jgi:hypothetical protein